jgi:hypothetical protein
MTWSVWQCSQLVSSKLHHASTVGCVANQVSTDCHNDCLQVAEELGLSNHNKLLGQPWKTSGEAFDVNIQKTGPNCAEILSMQVLGARQRVLGEHDPNVLRSVAWSWR